MLNVVEAKVVFCPSQTKIVKDKKTGKDKEKNMTFPLGVRVVFDGQLEHDTPIMLKKKSDTHNEKVREGKYHGMKLFFKMKKLKEITSVSITQPPQLELDFIDRPIMYRGKPLAIEGEKQDAHSVVKGGWSLDEFCKVYKGLAPMALKAVEQALIENAEKKAA